MPRRSRYFIFLDVHFVFLVFNVVVDVNLLTSLSLSLSLSLGGVSPICVLVRYEMA